MFVKNAELGVRNNYAICGAEFKGNYFPRLRPKLAPFLKTIGVL